MEEGSLFVLLLLQIFNSAAGTLFILQSWSLSIKSIQGSGL